MHVCKDRTKAGARAKLVRILTDLILISAVPGAQTIHRYFYVHTSVRHAILPGPQTGICRDNEPKSGTLGRHLLYTYYPILPRYFLLEFRWTANWSLQRSAIAPGQPQAW
jgi:hypothetical protein